ncbi:unnamed protein product [Anisakis simplex]|uniref:Uncharacterized protein n=1 Tax=Anisakis simplex TaxID=6269 RepID=A0A0M3KFY7_ANISI|nr:unnamed protein product [Anisakis simplex]
MEKGRIHSTHPGCVRKCLEAPSLRILGLKPNLDTLATQDNIHGQGVSLTMRFKIHFNSTLSLMHRE